MGNSQSTDSPHSPSPTSAASTPAKKPRERDASQHRSRSVGQQQAASGGQAGTGSRKASATSSAQSAAGQQAQQQAHAPPSSLVPATPVASTSTSNAQALATVSVSPSSTHSRHRSITTSGAALRSLPDEQQADDGATGQAGPKARTPSRSATLPHSLGVGEKERAASSPDSPHGSGVADQEYSVPYAMDHSDFNRPPRLPLAIQSAHEPGSPIPSFADAGAPALEPSEVDAMLARRASMLSSTTLDDDEGADAETFAVESDPSQPKVSTQITYSGPSDDSAVVYVTGTFVGWERKFRLPFEPSVGAFTATFPLPTGTHHLKFLVDGDMRTSDDLPTTVDYTNALVNYIEVVAPSPARPSEPMPIPGTAASAGQMPGTADGTSAAAGPRNDSGDTRRDEFAPPTTQTAPITHPQAPSTEPEEQRLQRLQRERERAPRPHYTTSIPAFLMDLDHYQTPDDARYQRAAKASETLPTPPSLPGFMGKSILNAATPHKDDASVLAMPNHTVINHLATSSIKNGVLATSGTTRYKRKFLTTIMYKPTASDG